MLRSRFVGILSPRGFVVRSGAWVGAGRRSSSDVTGSSRQDGAEEVEESTEETAAERFRRAFDGMICPSDRVYAKSHCWIKHEDPLTVRIGVSHHFLRNQGKEIVQIDPSPVSSYFCAGDELAYVSTDTGSTMVPCPVPGSLLATNSDAVLNPAVLSEQPYGDGWLVTLKLDDESATSKLLSSREYEKHCSEHPQDQDPANLEDEHDPTKEQADRVGQEATDDEVEERTAGPDGDEAKDDRS
ncbi:hypothetical protein NDN08_000200 [Rhodosorus marinus]|uniref:Glycine cleavage system H protein n=1 Tax=Rhodosorus marinus TaxID=101924 RepID=A0AAV8UHG5_9RHOD|nr:hypothetical protein NDN08_000200 [Rhodosorus marinus]